MGEIIRHFDKSLNNVFKIWKFVTNKLTIILSQNGRGTFKHKPLSDKIKTFLNTIKKITLKSVRNMANQQLIFFY